MCDRNRDGLWADEPELDEPPFGDDPAELAGGWADMPDHAAGTADAAIALLRATGIEAHSDFDCGDDDGRGSGLMLYVACRPGCRPVAQAYDYELGDSLACEAPEGADSACERALAELEKAGAFRDGWRK